MAATRDEAICKHLLAAQVSLKLSKPGTDDMIERMRVMAGETIWHGDTDGTKQRLCGMLTDLRKLTGRQLAAASGPVRDGDYKGKPGLLPGVDGAIDQIEKAIKLCA